MKTNLLAGAVVAAVLVSACAFSPQVAQINPGLDVASGDLGKSTTVAFRVVDERDSKSIGNRGAAFGKGAKITTSQDVAALVHQRISEGLGKKGFAITDFREDASPRLTVELRSLDYDTSVGFWTGGVQIVAALKGVSVRDGKTYERMYRYDNEKRVVVVPTANRNDEMLNAALTDVMTQFFDDVGMLRHLAGQ
ncbi:MAG TPA: YajG family lipoprotein [Steroidobacteraceae bacterium]|nr:YajG family lipoprotein [Steroidobacteraceae bacterium]HQX47176.1 YajG family lipoprotein [Steroidobacteraceae bacterium]HQX79105.1 YajG family lipoprotein [Steroidobacteraceae bacterium]HQZ80322.1 YajG family lipoprotein [Steroidobacteraceae bacterium]